MPPAPEMLSPSGHTTKRLKTAPTEEQSRSPRDFFAALPLEILEEIYAHIPDACRATNASSQHFVWQRDPVVMQLSSRWLWLILPSRYSIVEVGFDNILPLLDTVSRLPRLAASVDALVVRFKDQARDIASTWLWDVEIMQQPLPRPVPTAHERTFVDRRKIYKVPFWNTSLECWSEESKRPQGCCAMCSARGRPGWPFQSDVYEENALVNRVLPETDGDETELILTSGPTGKGPIKLSGWGDWFAAFAKLAALCKPRALVWHTCLAEIPKGVIDELASLHCIRLLLLGRTYISPNYRPLVTDAELLRLQTGNESYMPPPFPLTRDKYFLPGEAWVTVRPEDYNKLPEAVIDDAPEESYGHTFFQLLRGTRAQRLQMLSLVDLPREAVGIYQSPGLLPVLLTVPRLEGIPDCTDEQSPHLALVEAVETLRNALDAAAAPVYPHTVREMVQSLQACVPIVEPVCKAAEAICERFNRRPDASLWPTHLQELFEVDFEDWR